MEVLALIKKESNFRKKRYTYNKKLRLKENIMTYGVLALACKTQEKAQELLSQMKEEQLKPNIEIFGTLLRNGTAHNDFRYITQVLYWVKEEGLLVNQTFLEHLEKFNEKCLYYIEKNETSEQNIGKGFKSSYQRFSNDYTKWIKETDVKKALQTEHPWEQFKDSYPETFQKSNVTIIISKRVYKRSRKYVPYRTHI